jgi:putative transposase
MVPLHIQLANSTLRRVIKRLHFPLDIMLVCVRWYAAYPLSLRNLEEMMAERGVIVDHATVHRWALKMLPVLAAVFRRRKLPRSMRAGGWTRPTYWGGVAGGSTCTAPSTS